jgi:hypothetical protein
MRRRKDRAWSFVTVKDAKDDQRFRRILCLYRSVIGALLVGETILIASGFPKQRGLACWSFIVLVAMAGVMLGIQLVILLWLQDRQ